MACEGLKAAADAAQHRWSSLMGHAAGVCATNGHSSSECQSAQIEAQDAYGAWRQAVNAYNECMVPELPPPPPRMLETAGYVTFLTVVEPGSGYGGGATNWFDADVIFKLHTRPDKAFGFQLRQDAGEPVRRGMLAQLENAIANKLHVITDYIEIPTFPNNNSFVIRVALTREPPGPQPPSGLINEDMMS